MKKIDYKNYERPSDYLYIEENNAVIRLVSKGAISKEHSMKTARGYIPLGECTESVDCKQCLAGNEAKFKFSWVVMNRKTGSIKMLRCGKMLGQLIVDLVRNEEQDEKEYDILIKRTGKGLNTTYYVAKGEVKPLTEEELSFIEPNKKYLVHKYFEKPRSGQ